MTLCLDDRILNPALYNCLLRSDERSHAHDVVSRELSDHRLVWRGGRPNTRLYKTRFRQIQSYILQYGAAVEVRPDIFHGFSIVHTSLRGEAEVEIDGRTIRIAEGRTAFLSPRRDISLNWDENTVQFILRIPDELFHAASEHGDDRRPPQRTPGLLLARDQGAVWNSLVEAMLATAALPQETPRHGTCLDRIERALASFLFPLAHAQASSPEPSAEPPAPASTSVSLARMKRLTDYMEQHLSEPLTLIRLAEATGMSLRTLNEVCHRHHGVAPMQLLRDMRLEAARAYILSRRDASVTEAALMSGFQHLGRFSMHYHARFGEYPKRTKSCVR